jgi:hypothetical protein
MVKRWRKEWEIHGRDFKNCHCGAGIGTMRKHRPLESHPSSSCGICAVDRFFARMERRRKRYGAKSILSEGLLEWTIWGAE